MTSALIPASSLAFSSSILMKLTGWSGGAAWAAPSSRMPEAMTGTRMRRISASHHAGAAAERRPAVAELAALHGLSLAAVGNGIDAEVRADAVDVHQEV